MNIKPVIVLKHDKGGSISAKHPWIFSGAIAETPGKQAHGGFYQVKDAKGNVLGTGSFNAISSIAVRLFAFGEAEIDYGWLLKRVREADERRKLAGYGPGTATTGYRAVFGEADGLPGLVVDRYADTIVFQLSTAAMDARRDEIAAVLTEVFEPKAIVERSDLPSRKEEALEDVCGARDGGEPGLVEFLENGLKFIADPVNGQKTGFFLDQKNLRLKIREFSSGREALNLFSYTGAASIYALAGGAKSVLNVDSSEKALEGVLENAKRNGFGADKVSTEKADVFSWLSKKSDPEFGMVIIDPPAIIKSRKDRESGMKAYHFINRAAMRLVKDGGIFITSSCSANLAREDFGRILAKASAQAGVTLHTLATIGHSSDHPVSVYFPEGEYLKSYVFEVRR